MGILESLLTEKDNKCSEYCISFLNGYEDELLKILKTKRTNYLYDSVIHGKNHSERVLLYSFILSKQVALNEDEHRILMDAAWYHDIGRDSESDDSFHGLSGARKVDKAVDLSNYSQEDVNFLKAVIDVHSRDDSKMDAALWDYNIEETEENIEKFHRMANILKDADALDRMRFNEYCDSKLDPRYLRYEYSKDLIDYSHKINLIYQNTYQKDYQPVVEDGGLCYHSIGFDFFKLDSILKHGVLSVDKMKEHGIKICKNFDGGNQNSWISVIDCSLIKEQAKIENKTSAHKEFVKHGISFLCKTDDFVDALTLSDKDKALLLGVPYDKGNYYDERYVYQEIPQNNILKIEIPIDYACSTINSLNYIYNRLSVDQIQMKIDYFKDYFKEVGITINDRELNELLEEYDTIVKTSHNPKKLPYLLKDVTKKINGLIQEGMDKYFKALLQTEEDITVMDIVNCILFLNNIDYRFYDLNNESVVFTVNKEYNRIKAPKIKKFKINK